MKKMNRREFLALTGAAVVALSLAGCDDAPPAPPAPPAPTTPKEAKVLEVINKYRGSLPALKPDSGLDPAMDIAVKIAKGEMKASGEGLAAYKNARADYNKYYSPIGLRENEDDYNYMHPVLVYSDNAEEMTQNLNDYEKGLLKSPEVTLVNIRTFELKGKTYWVAVIADRKK